MSPIPEPTAPLEPPVFLLDDCEIVTRRPPPQPFWIKYNGRSEFALGFVASTLIHILVATAQVGAVVYIIRNVPDRSTVPVKVIDVDGGFDDTGTGQMGSGGSDAALAEENHQALQDALDVLPSPQALPEAKANLQTALQVVDPSSDIPVAEANAAAWAMAQKSMRDKMLGVGGRVGEGGQPGSGSTGQAGEGNGGTGADSSRARSLRWVLRFRTAGGRNYLDQITTMGAIVAVPLPPNEEKCWVFDDLTNPRSRHLATDDELKKLAGMLKFIDARRASVNEVAEALQLGFVPRSFWAFFPKSLEEQLARKEVSYRNRRPEDIEETVFQVTIRDGGYSIVVYDQRVRQ